MVSAAAGRAAEEPVAPVLGLPAADVALFGILFVLLGYTLHFAAPVLRPIAFALLISLALKPVVRVTTRLRIPRLLGAALVLATVLAGIGATVYWISEPAAQWMARAPATLDRLKYRLRPVRESVETLEQASRQVKEVAASADSVPVVQVKAPTVTEMLLGRTPRALAALLVILVLLYFLLVSDDRLLRKLVRLTPRLRHRKQTVDTVRSIEREVSNYLLTLSMINLVLGLVCGLAFALIGLPHPALWGALVAVANFAPYVGPASVTIVLTLVGFSEFDGVGRALLVPGSYLILTILEGQIVTPVLLGRQLSLSPFAIFVALMFWGWMWGIPGALIAVPMLVTLKIVCERIDGLRFAAELLGR